MKNFIQLLIFIFFTCNLYANNKVLYPVYSIKLDVFSEEIAETIIVDRHSITSKITHKFIDYAYKFNLNNLLLFNTKQDSNYTYNLLGKIDIDENNKLKFESIENSNEYVLQKQIELEKNIEHINQNNFTFEEIKKILDVDLINEDLGEKLYQNKEYNISVEEATKNLINCRLYEQIIKNKIYFLYGIIYNNKEINYNHYLKWKNDLEELCKKGNIYNQLNSKFTTKSFKDKKENKIDN